VQYGNYTDYSLDIDKESGKLSLEIRRGFMKEII